MAQPAVRRVARIMPQLFVETAENKKEKLQVAAYARVSTEREEQEDSFERQVEHYKQLICINSEWDYVGIYSDPGISGTRAEMRPGFLQMITDCRNGRIQKVLVKSISRFARITVDALVYIRELKDLGISVYFESENIVTMSTGGEVLLTILAAMAEQESRTISSNIKWAYQRKFQAGEVSLNTKHMLGYNKVGEDECGRDVYGINEEEADIIRQVYSEYLKGISIMMICRHLEEAGKLTKHKKEKWRYSTVYSILTNEKYTGNALLGKTYKPDVLSKKRQKSDGMNNPIYYVEGSHPAIIEQEVFDMVKQEMQRRQEATEDTVGGGKYSSKYPFSGMLECAVCGHKLRRQVRTTGSKKKVPYWCCSYRVTNDRSVCDSHHVREDVLEATYIEAMRKVTESVAEVTDAIRSGIDTALSADSKKRIAELEDEIMEIQEKALELNRAKRRMEIGEEDYAAQIKELSEKIKAKEAERDALHDSEMKYAQIRIWLEAFETNVNTGQILTTTDVEIMRMMVDRIVVGDDAIEIHLKCGVSIQQEYVK